MPRRRTLSYSVYDVHNIDNLLDDLSSLGVGCFCDCLFTGALYYADDLVILAPSPAALRIMLHCCEDFALSHGLPFNASFPGVGPFILTLLFQSYYLSLYGSNLWILSCTALHECRGFL